MNAETFQHDFLIEPGSAEEALRQSVREMLPSIEVASKRANVETRPSKGMVLE
jgi:hypothetical protein